MAGHNQTHTSRIQNRIKKFLEARTLRSPKAEHKAMRDWIYTMTFVYTNEQVRDLLIHMHTEIDYYQPAIDVLVDKQIVKVVSFNRKQEV
jgi:hypothetical protein